MRELRERERETEWKRKRESCQWRKVPLSKVRGNSSLLWIGGSDCSDPMGRDNLWPMIDGQFNRMICIMQLMVIYEFQLG
jgi:hypothetical protein